MLAASGRAARDVTDVRAWRNDGAQHCASSPRLRRCLADAFARTAGVPLPLLPVAAWPSVSGVAIRGAVVSGGYL
jgi:hypothetical protein